MKKHSQVFMDIDTQFDFMHPEGKLYVPQAERLVPQLKTLLDYAQRHEIPVLASVDAHAPDDPEFADFPPHCVLGTPGQKKIDATQVTQSRLISTQAQDLDLTDCNHVVLEKTVFDIFANPNAEVILKETEAQDAIVFGVATDYCVKAAVKGLCQRGYAVTVVSDAIRAVTPEGQAETLRLFKELGVQFKTTAEIIGEIG